MSRKFIMSIVLTLVCMYGLSQNVQRIECVSSNKYKWVLLKAEGAYGAEDDKGNVILPLTTGVDSVFYLGEGRHPTQVNEQPQTNYYPVFGIRQNVGGEPVYSFIGAAYQGLRFGTLYTVDKAPVYYGYPKKVRKVSLEKYNSLIAENPTADGYYKRGCCYAVSTRDLKPAFEDCKTALQMEDCSLTLALEVINMMNYIEFRRAVKKENRAAFWGALPQALEEISSSLANMHAAGGDGETRSLSGSSSRKGGSSHATGKKSGNCPHCHGSKRCGAPNCNGAGFWYAEGQKVICPKCHGSTICTYCHGTGKR